MKSVINDKLTVQERVVLQIYRNPNVSGIRRQIRLSIQYALGTGIFLVLAVWLDQHAYSVVVYLVFILWMFLRIRGAKKVAGILPGIIEKYEQEIIELRAKVAPDEDGAAEDEGS